MTPITSAVTALTVAGMTGAFTTVGDTAEELLKGLAGHMPRNISFVSMRKTRYTMVVLSPLVAGVIARDGYTKQNIKEYLFKNVRLTAAECSAMEGDYVREVDICKLAEEGRMRKEYCTTDPTQMLPITNFPDEFLIVVSGNPNRNRCIVLCHAKGHPVTREIKLPKNWDDLLKNLKIRRQEKKT